jgi:drug/metabolite transporter (DMT)-like permease
MDTRQHKGWVTVCSVSKRRLDTTLGLAAILLWSTSVALSRSLGEQLGPLTTASLIYLIGGALGTAVLALSGKLPALRALPRRYLYGCGGLFVLYMASLYLGLGLADTHSQVLQVGLLNYLWPTLTVLLSVPILRLRARPLLVPGALLATAGVFLATTQGQPLNWNTAPLARGWANLGRSSLPYLLGLSAAFSWALYSTLSRRWAGKAAGQTAGQAVPLFMLGTGLVLGTARLLSTEQTHWTARAGAELAYMVVGSNLAYAFWERAMRRGDIVLVAAASLFTPLLSTLVSMLYLGVRPGPRLWIGCALVIAGAAICKANVQET